MKNVTFKELIAYHQNELTPKRRKEIARFLKLNSGYKDIIDGLEVISNELKEDESIESFLEQKKESLFSKIFEKEKVVT